jgi:hypothetical protein
VLGQFTSLIFHVLGESEMGLRDLCVMVEREREINAVRSKRTRPQIGSVNRLLRSNSSRDFPPNKLGILDC